MVTPEREVLYNKSCNGLYCHDMEDPGLVNFQHGGRKPRRIIPQRGVRGQGGQAGIGNVLLLVTETFKPMVRTLKNFPAIIENVRKFYMIYGCDVSVLKGKTVRQQPKRV